MKRDYILKVWISTIVSSPIILMVLSTIAMAKSSGMDSGAFDFILFAIGYGFLLSLPTFLICYFFLPKLYKKIQNPVKLKLTIISMGLVCTIITFFILYGPSAYDLNVNYAALTFTLLYGICIIIFGLIYKIHKNTLPIA